MSSIINWLTGEDDAKDRKRIGIGTNRKALDTALSKEAAGEELSEQDKELLREHYANEERKRRAGA